jgi:hypothetical protein
MKNITTSYKSLFSAAMLLCFCLAAQGQSFPASGTCALLYNEPVPYGHTPVPVQKSHTVMAEIDFSAMTGKFHIVDINYTTSSNHAVPPSGTITESFSFVPGPFSPSPGFRQIQFTPSGKKMNLYSKSNQKVLLVQGVNIKGSGVCLF